MQAGLCDLSPGANRLPLHSTADVALLEPIMDHRLDDFVHRQNLARFKRQLDNASDDAERKMLQALLLEEELKQPKVNRG
jgi:hypothetical protein